MKKHEMVPGAGGHGSRQGSPDLNKHLMKMKGNIERTTHTQDTVPIVSGTSGWPSMYDMARDMTRGKWGMSGKDVKVGK